jgi:hypothetical protein
VQQKSNPSSTAQRRSIAVGRHYYPAAAVSLDSIADFLLVLFLHGKYPHGF